MRLLIALLLTLLPISVGASDVACPDIAVTAQAPTAQEAQVICDAALEAADVLADYGIEAPGPLEIAVLPAFEMDCVGVFHCGKARIELLSLEALAEKRLKDSIFAAVPLRRYFTSILLHEMVHAAYDSVPCPLPSCRATSEYLAYALQIEFFEPELQAKITTDIDPEIKVVHGEISVGILMIAPDRFALRAWSHFSQRPDPRAYVVQIMSGAIVFDRFHP